MRRAGQREKKKWTFCAERNILRSMKLPKSDNYAPKGATKPRALRRANRRSRSRGNAFSASAPAGTRRAPAADASRASASMCRGNTYENRFAACPETDAAGMVKGYSPLPPFFAAAALACVALFAAAAVI